MILISGLFDRAGKYRMQLIDVAGHTVYPGVAEATGTGCITRIERDSLAAGSYHIKGPDESGNSYIIQLVLGD